MGDTLAPRLGAVYDVFGDSSLKVFGSFGIYYDVMKLYMGQLTFGGSKRIEDYYALNNPDWTEDRGDRRSHDASTRPPGGRQHLRRFHGLPAAFPRTGSIRT